MDEHVLEERVRELVADGKLIEAGWVELRALWLRPDANARTEEILRTAFIAGAQHLWGLLLRLDPPRHDPRTGEFIKTDVLAAELEALEQEVVERAV